MAKWTSTKGQAVEVKAAIVNEYDRNGNVLANTESVRVIATVNGVPECLNGINRQVSAAAKAAGVVATVGRVGLNAERLALVEAEEAAANADPRVIRRAEALAKAAAEQADYRASRAKIAKAMQD
jgi:hypothetical protein